MKIPPGLNEHLRKKENGLHLNKPGRPGSREDGQSTVEFAMLIPIMVILIVAALQVFFTINCYLVVASASRDGARQGAATNDEAAASSTANQSLSSLAGEKPGIKVSFPKGRSRGMPVKVSVSYRVPLLLPGLKSLLPELRISRSTVMYLERGPE